MDMGQYFFITFLNFFVFNYMVISSFVYVTVPSPIISLIVASL